MESGVTDCRGDEGLRLPIPGLTKSEEPVLDELVVLSREMPNYEGTSHVEQLMQKIDELIQKHKADLSKCLRNWIHNERKILLQAAPSDIHDLSTASRPKEAILPNMVSACPTKIADALHLPLDHKCKSFQSVVADSTPASNHSNAITHGDAKKNLIDSIGEQHSRHRHARRNWSDLVIEETRAVVKSQRTALQRITDSHYYEAFSTTLIMANAIFIGWQTQHVALQFREFRSTMNDLPADQAPLVVSVIFTILFTIELGLRWIADGFLQFFQTADLPWNLMDIVIVTLALVDCLLESLDAKNSLTHNIALLRVLRIIRVVRVARIIRIKRFFKELRVMVYSIMGSLKSLLWVLLVLFLMLYMFGIGFTSSAVAHLREVEDGPLTKEVQDLEKSFGTLDLSLTSLFMAMSGGNDWAMYYDALAPLGAILRFMFLLYISFAIFAVVNIVTGVFVDSALQNNTRDRELIIQEEIQSKRDYLENMAAIFEEIDADDTGFISQEEFEQSLKDERVMAYFSAMRLDVSDARTLFTLLDYDQSEGVNIKEFISGCFRLQGESRSLDIKIMQYEVRYLGELLVNIQDLLTPAGHSKEALSG